MTKRKLTQRLAVSASVLFAMAGCGGNSASPLGSTIVVQPATAKVQLAVGTANLFGTATGLNVVSTLRTPQGKSVLVSTPSLTGPFTLPATPGTPDATGATFADGPSTSEIAAGNLISGSAQVTPGTPAADIPATTFGIRGGVFANGFFPANANNTGTARDTPYTQPFYDQLTDAAGDPNAFTPWGGPPAFDPNGNGEGTRDGTFDASVLGVSEGITVFEGVTPRGGTYSLSVLIPTTGASTTLTTSTNLPAVTLLPAVTPPALTANAAGGGTLPVTLVAGATDALVEVTDLGAPDGNPNCHAGPGNGGVAYYTIHLTASGTATLPDTDGPRTTATPFGPTPTICTAAQNAAVGNTTGADYYSVQLIEADYPIYASNYLFNLTSQTPVIVGARGSDDITISPIFTTVPATAAAAVRQRFAHLHIR